jgi:hypothetical protein
MKPFKIWLETRKEEEIKDYLLSQLNLDEEHGLSVSLDSLDPDETIATLRGHGNWQTLSPEKQKSIEDKIRNGLGTVGDLVDEMVERDATGGMGGVSPPIEPDTPEQGL